MIILAPDEKIIFIKRRHKYILLKKMIPGVLVFSIVVFFMISLLFIKSLIWPAWLVSFSPNLSLLDLRYFLIFLSSLILQIFWIIIFLSIIDYYFDRWIITNKRIIHAELRVLFNCIISSIPYDKIQDITIDIHGILATLLRFGNLKIQTAGGFREFIFENITEPHKVKEIILKAQREFLEKK